MSQKPKQAKYLLLEAKKTPSPSCVRANKKHNSKIIIKFQSYSSDQTFLGRTLTVNNEAQKR